MVISSPVASFPRRSSATWCISSCGCPTLSSWWTSCGKKPSKSPRAAPSVDTTDDTLHQLARALQGLTLDEARHAVRRALATRACLGPESVPALLEEKRLLVNRTGVIEFVADGTDIGQIGGLEVPQEVAAGAPQAVPDARQPEHRNRAQGRAGHGHSGLRQKPVGQGDRLAFELPLYRIDMIEVFSGRHGNPKAPSSQACQMLEDMAPAVVWFDEIETGITSADSGGEQGRIFAFFLTWMQEKARGLFVAATANRIDLLPAEMIRKGRFDEVFFVDLPLDEERVEIFKVHLIRRGVDPVGSTSGG